MAMDEAVLLQQVVAGIEGTLQPNNDIRKQAELHIQKVEQEQPGVALVYLKVAQTHTNPQVQLMAAICFKNFIKRTWSVREDERDFIGEQYRGVIKTFIVDVMLLSPDNIRAVLSVAITTIAESDFPKKWEALLPNLVSKIDLNQPNLINGILQTLHALFKRYRYAMHSSELMVELKFVLEVFQTALLQLMQATDQQITAQSENRPIIYKLYENMFLLFKIFQSLSSHDLPEFFEDHLPEFAALMKKYLEFSSKALLNEHGGDEEKAGNIEKVRTSIVQICELYTQKYAEEFTMLGSFVETVWGLLVSTGTQSKYDMLVSESIRFLSTVAKNRNHQAMFSNPDTLKSICEKVIIPNMQFLPSDEELFESNAMEYLRRDLEGSDFDTRRRAACDFVRALTEMFPAEVTQIFSAYIGLLLQQFQANPAANWRAKDTAIVLVIALAVKTSTASLGVTGTNDLVNLQEFFQLQVLPALSSAVNDDLAVLKADSIKFVHTFRNQLPKPILLATFPLLVNHLAAESTVVATYSAITLERIIALKVAGQDVFSPQELAPFLQTLLQSLFALIKREGDDPAKLAENDPAMKTVMRLIIAFKSGIKPYMPVLLNELTRILSIISKVSSNPKFNHNLFESIGNLVKYASEQSQDSVATFESLLFPSFQEILRSNSEELTPYVFQILAQLLELRSGPNSVSSAYLGLFEPLLSAYLWEQQSNVTPLVRLIRAYFYKGASIITAKESNLVAVLGVFQRLIASRISDHEGFYLLHAIVETVPLSILTNYLQTIFTILLQRLTGSRGGKYSRCFVILVFHFASLIQNGPVVLVQLLNQIQPGLFLNLYQAVILAEAVKASGYIERKIAVVGLGKFLLECPFLWDHPNLTSLTAEKIVAILEAPHQDVDSVNEESDFVDVEGYQPLYSSLASSQKLEDDPLIAIKDAAPYTAQTLAAFVQANPGKLRVLLGAMNEGSAKGLAALLAQQGVNFQALLSA